MPQRRARAETSSPTGRRRRAACSRTQALDGRARPRPCARIRSATATRWCGSTLPASDAERAVRHADRDRRHVLERVRHREEQDVHAHLRSHPASGAPPDARREDHRLVVERADQGWQFRGKGSSILIDSVDSGNAGRRDPGVNFGVFAPVARFCYRPLRLGYWALVPDALASLFTSREFSGAHPSHRRLPDRSREHPRLPGGGRRAAPLRPRALEGPAPGALQRGEAHHLRVRRGARRQRLDPVQHPLLRLRPDLHRVRRGGGVPAALGDRLPRARACSPTSRGSCSSASWWSPSPTCGARATSRGCAPRTGPEGGMSESQRSHPQPVRATALVVTSVDQLVNWSRKNSIWFMTFGLACCAIEMMATGAQPLRPRPLRDHARGARRARATS